MEYVIIESSTTQFNNIIKKVSLLDKMKHINGDEGLYSLIYKLDNKRILKVTADPAGASYLEYAFKNPGEFLPKVYNFEKVNVRDQELSKTLDENFYKTKYIYFAEVEVLYPLDKVIFSLVKSIAKEAMKLPRSKWPTKVEELINESKYKKVKGLYLKWIEIFNKIGKKKYYLDINTGNVMQRKNGNLIILDAINEG